MKSYSEYRAAAWKETREGHWVAKFLLVAIALSIVFGVVQAFWNGAIASMGIQTWTMFFEAKAKAVMSGLDLAVPSRAVAIRMTEASAFETFVGCIIYGIMQFAMFSLFLRAAKGERERWFAPSFGGFKRPLGLAWLYFRCFLQVALWSLLFIVPGIVAVYRYCQCWNLKVENPDWSAGKCLAESGRMMKGRKWQRFSLDCSYWKPITLLMLGLLVMVFLAEGLVMPLQSPAFAAMAGVVFLVPACVCGWGSFVLAAYMSIGQAMFYLDLKGTGASAAAENDTMSAH